MFNVSRYLSLISLLLIILAVINGLFILYGVNNLENDAGIINHSGIVRGSIQKLAKLECANVPSDDLIRKIDDTLQSLSKGEENFQLKGDETKYKEALRLLELRWNELKSAILAYRKDSSENNLNQIITTSEVCWDIADDAVLKAQLTSETKVKYLWFVFIIIGMNLSTIFIVLILVRIYVKNRLENMAHYDSMTGILNRSSFEKTIKSEMYRSKRYNRSLTLILFDVDRFKIINDTYGHSAGDRILEDLAKIAGECLRKSDSLFRIGGEEFAILAVETDLEKAKDLAERIRFVVMDHEFQSQKQVTASFGVAEYIKSENYDSFFNRTDSALYKAKENGKNKTEISV